MGNIIVSSPEDLHEIQYLLKRKPRLGKYFLNKKIQHRMYGNGIICPTYELDGVLLAHFENGYGIKTIGLYSWQNGNICSLEIENDLFQRVKYTNIILGGKTIIEAVRYLKTVVENGLAHQLKSIDITLIFENYPGLENLLPDNVLEAIEKERLWNSIPPKSRFHLLIRDLQQSQPDDVPDLLSQLRILLKDLSSLEYWREIPDQFLRHQELWSKIPIDVRVERLFEIILRREANEAELQEFAEHLKINRYQHYSEKLPDDLLFETVLFSSLLPYKQFEYLLLRLSQISECREREVLIHRLVDFLTDSNRVIYWEKIPNNLITEQHIWPSVPVRLKVPVLLAKIANAASIDEEKRQRSELSAVMRMPEALSLWNQIPKAWYEYPEFYEILPVGVKFNYLLSQINSKGTSESRESRIRELAEILTVPECRSFWRQVPDQLVLDTLLINTAPFETRLRIFKPIAEDLVTHPAKSSMDEIEWTDNDFRLAVQWMNPPVAKREQSADEIRKVFEQGLTKERLDELSRVLSARAAELAVKRYFEELGYQTEDVSILQLSGLSDERWKQFDIKCGDFAVDVKNSRASKHNKKVFAEQCVNKFKVIQERGDVQEVKIAGVFSQLLLPAELMYPTSYKGNGNHNIQVLGLTSYSKLYRLMKRYQIPGKFELSFHRNYLENKSFLPPWVYDYPSDVYQKRNDTVAKLQKIKQPIFELAKTANFSPLPFIFLLENPLVDDLEIPNWQLAFAREFCSLPLGDRLSLPQIYLTVLRHFILMATDEHRDTLNYEPIQYKEILYPRQFDTQYPLFAYDPLDTVNSLIETLQLLWINEHGFLHDFTIFQLSQLNVFKGKSDEKDNGKTLIAYCGKCRYTPLIFGKHKSCECGKLRCPECDYCKENCVHYQERHANPSDNNKHTDKELTCPPGIGPKDKW